MLRRGFGGGRIGHAEDRTPMKQVIFWFVAAAIVLMALHWHEPSLAPSRPAPRLNGR